MGRVWSTSLVVLLFIVPGMFVDGNELRLWRHVTLSQSKLSNMDVYKILVTGVPSAGPTQILRCSNNCTMHDWCNLWCNDPSSAFCIFSNMFVMPTYLENSTDILNCYTRRPLDYAATATITAGLQNRADALKVKENMIDGIYNLHMDDCFYSANKSSDRWFVLDLGKAVVINHIMLVIQPNVNAAQITDIEVRVGTSAVVSPQGLGAYELFGWFPGPGTPNEYVDMISPRPVCIRYVSVQTMSEDFPLQIAHIEVY